jgi:hypothetical protein
VFELWFVVMACAVGDQHSTLAVMVDEGWTDVVKSKWSEKLPAEKHLLAHVSECNVLGFGDDSATTLW